MPFFEIPPEKIEHLPLFGYDLIHDDDEYAWYTCPRGRLRVSKRRPFVWAEDDTDAIQLGAIGVVLGPP